MRRWVEYQRERFPLAAHAPLIAAFSGSAVCLSSLLRGHVAVPAPGTLAVAFMTALLFFLQLRIADEFKDADEDARYRPYRPVPRGLVTLRELGLVGAAAAAVQLVLALWLAPALTGLLAVTWLYLALMTREFFAAAWLRARPVAYMTSHMVIVPLIDLYATACDWLPAGRPRPPAGLAWFIVLSFFNGLVVEIGRKIRAPADEEAGVDTYSALWGRGRAVAAWLGMIAVTAACALVVAARIDAVAAVGVLLALLVAAAAAAARRFLRDPRPGAGRRIETVTGVWTLLMYLSLGAVPLAVAVWRAAGSG